MIGGQLLNKAIPYLVSIRFSLNAFKLERSILFKREVLLRTLVEFYFEPGTCERLCFHRYCLPFYKFKIFSKYLKVYF